MRILTIDDHRLFSEGLRSLLVGWRPQAEIVAAQNFTEAVNLIERCKPDLILADLGLPDARESELIDLLKSVAPLTPIIVVSMSENPHAIRTVLKAGARGFIRKTDTSAMMVAALNTVLAGGVAVPSDFLNSAMSANESQIPHLSQRQREVLGLLGKGLSNKEIARVLDIAEPTVKVHVHRLLQTLGTTSRARAAVIARDERFA